MNNRDKVRNELLGAAEQKEKQPVEYDWHTYRSPKGSDTNAKKKQTERKKPSSDQIRNKGEKSKPAKKTIKKKKKHWLRNLIIVLLLLVAIAVIFIYSQINGHINYVPVSEIEVNSEILADLEEETADYKTIALFGVDSRASDLSAKTRTDTIMLVSLNTKTNDVRILSVYRDTYLNIGADIYTKCNAAYAKGGPAQALSMLNKNLDLNVKEYVTIGFDGVIKAIDSLGGVAIPVEQDEIQHLNQYQQDLIKSNMKDYEYQPVVNTGKQTLNGLQALSYCRIRYTSGDDYKRTSRQRIVLEALVEKMKSNPLALQKMGTDILEGIATNMKSTELMALLPKLFSVDITKTDGVPFEDYRTTRLISGSGDCVLPNDLATNVSLLHEFLYGTENYKPSGLVEEYSAYIRNR